MNRYFNYIEPILFSSYTNSGGEAIGKSREGRAIYGYKLGNGPKNVSLIAGNHADEPIGPLLLKKLVHFLQQQPYRHELLTEFTWYIIPHNNPDGEAVNQAWYAYNHTETNLYTYLKHVERELPGDDVEFGFPIENEIESLRTENEAAYQFWKSANAPFHLHASLHGMRASFGAWFLLDEQWKERTTDLQQACVALTKELGYPLFDLDRLGEKGFVRIAEGFCTRPSGQYMREHFTQLGDLDTAQKFHASSMESIRSLGGDCLTLVSEMPLFLYPPKKRKLEWPDAHITAYHTLLNTWQAEIKLGTLAEEQLAKRAKENNIVAMPWADQMRLQWQLISAGLETVK